MGQVLYEQPREKLRARGAAQLTITELIQLIIGSGNARMSVMKLSKQVGQLLQKQNVDYHSLRAINGLGDAKACQLIGAIELGRRVAEGSIERPSSIQLLESLYLSEGSKPNGRQVVSYWLDGFGKEIDRKSYSFVKNEHYSVLAKRIFSDALAAAARSLLVLIVTKNSADGPNTQERGLTGSLSEMASLLNIQLEGIYAVYGSSYQEWGKTI